MTMIRRYAAHRPARLFIGILAAILLLSGPGGSGRPEVQAQANPIVAENQLAGDPNWDISGAGDPTIQGFATDISVNTGATVSFKVDTNASAYTIDIYRLGYYSGAGARKVATVLPSATLPQSQPACLSDNATGLVDCGNWGVSASWASTGAVSGVYVAKLTRTDSGGTSHINFVVRDDSRTADVVLQTADTTWQAYNKYGGASLYCAPGTNTSGTGVSNAGSAYNNSCARRAVKVSYNRPIDTRDHSAQSFLFSAEYPLLRFLEANGYNVKYWSGIDTDRIGAELSGVRKPKVFVSSGHDEYWSGDQRTRVEAARNAGVSLAFFSGNEVYWKTRYEASIDGSGTTYRTLVSYKDTLAGTKLDPMPNVTTGTWRDMRFGPPSDGARPENALIGAIWTVNSGTPFPAAITVPASMAGMRLWRNTRVADLTSGSATLATGTLGYEWGEDLDNGFRPAGLMHLSSTSVASVEKIIDYGATVGFGPATHNLTLYKHNSGALVFGASTVQWAWGLDAEHDDHSQSPTSHAPDQAMQQATVNLLADMGAQPASLQIGADPARQLVATPASADILAPTSTITAPAAGAQVESGTRVMVSGVAVDAGGVVAAVEVSVDAGLTWHAAQGTSAWSYEWSVGAVGSATIRARAIDDSGNLESALPGITVQVVIGECPCTSLWRPSAVPANPSAADSGQYELGVKFTSDISGFITGIRFYKGPANNGTHIGNLWTATGTLLATAIFTGETATGWQQVNFGAPVPIAANTIYVASYHTPNGGYSFDPAYFVNPVNSPPLRAPTSATSGGNGVYSPGGVAFPTQTFNANNYWVDPVFAASLEDSTAPVISNIKSTTIDSSRVTVTWTTNEASNTRIDYGIDPAILTASLSNLPAGTTNVSNSSFVTGHTLALTGLQPNTTYYYLVSSSDSAGNTATVAAPTFTVPGPTLRDTAATDFGAGTALATYVSQTADGEVILKPTAGAEFSGPTLPSGWIEVPWTTEGYSTIVDGVLLVDGARVATCATDVNGACLPGETTTSTPSAIYSAPKSLEFSANFSGDQFQHAGFAVTFGSASEPWAIFSTLSGGMLFARSNTGNGAIDTPIGVAPLGEFHRYRIDWNPNSVDYYIDGALVVSHAVTVPGPMRPVAASDFNPFGGIVFVDWMRMTPVATPGQFVSRVFDATGTVAWKSIQWTANVPAGTSLAISVRAGDTLDIDGSVQGTWTSVAAPGAFVNLSSRYIQYRADMASIDPTKTPELQDIIISTGSAPVAVDDVRAVAQNGSYTFPASGPSSLTANDTDADPGDTLSVVAVTAPSHGTAVVNGNGSVTYTPAVNYNGPDAFAYTVSDGLLTASATVTLDVRFGNIPPVANNDFYAVTEDTPFSIAAVAGILANDTDIETDPLTAQLVTLPLRGMLTLNTNGGFTYTPAVNYAGPDAFTYRAHDGTEPGNIATVQILVNQVNDPPYTVADSFNAMLNQPLDVPAPGVLANDRDVEVEDTAPLRAQLVSTTTRGQLTLNADGSFSYVPNADFLGTDSFTYAAVDRFNAVGETRTVTLTVALKAVTQSVASGTVSTGTGVSAGDPVNTAVTTSTPATVAIAQGVIADSTSPSGYTFLNQQVNITLTDPTGAPVTATTTNPLVFTFEIDLSLIPAGQTSQTFAIFRNGVLVPNCLGATTITAANLDPCVSERSNGTKVKLTVLTTRASHWNVGMEALGDNLFARPDGPYAASYETALIVPAPGVLANDLGPTSLTAVLAGTPVGGTVTLAPSGAFTFTPAPTFCGAASFTYELHKSPTEFKTATAAVTVNCIPIAGGDPVTVLEDSGPTTVTVLFNDLDPDAQAISISAVTQPANGVVVIGPAGAFLSYQPNPNFFGLDPFTYTVQDTLGGSATGAVNVTVTPVNDAPAFAAGANQTTLEDAGAQVVAPWATGLTAGPLNETGQVLSFSVTTDNPALFSAAPVVAIDGSLSYTAAPDANGSATVTVTLSDNGGTANLGADTSASQTFTIAVTPVNDTPAFTKGANQSLFEDTGAQAVAGWATGISAGPANETAQVLTFNVVNDNPALFSVQPAVSAGGTLTYDPAPNAVGVATVSVTLSDNGGTANGGVDTTTPPQAFTITLNLVNDAPSFLKGADQTVLEDTAAATVAGWATSLSAGPADESGQALNFIVSNSNNALFSAQPAVSANGTLTFTPAANAYGSATVTVQLHDDGGVLNGGADTSAAQTFMIHLTAVNDAPSFTNGADQTVMVNSGLNTTAAWATAISAGPANEAGQVLSFIVSSSNPALFAVAPAVAPDGTLTFTPALNMPGSATVTVTVQDNGGTTDGGVNTSASQTFTINVVQGTTTISVASSNLTSLFKVPVILTATVGSNPPANLAGDAVTFKDGATTLGTGVLNGSGQATFTTSTLAVGTHAITAVFAGNAAYLGSTSAAISQVIQPSATMRINFNVHALQDGTNRPRVKVVPVAGAIVRVYRRWEPCTDNLYVSTQPKKWGLVFDGADGPGGNPGCPNLTVGSYSAEGITDANGNVDIIVPPTTSKPNIDYLVIGRSLAFDNTNTPTAGDAIYAGHMVSSISANTIKKVLLHEIRMFSGKRVAGKALEEFGSYLAMVQPEEMEWTEDATLYPVILVAEGDWDVTTSVATPSGFVPSEPLSTNVADTTSAVQFTITDIGSEWTPTNVTHVVKHLGTTRVQTLSVPMINRKRTRAKIDYFTVEPGSSGNVLDVLVNDNVAPPKTLTITAVTPGVNGGTVAIAADGLSLLYTPPTAAYIGLDSFTYTIEDSEGVVSTGTARLRINSKPSLVINDLTFGEGNLGAAQATFTVTLSSPSENEISFDYATIDETAVAGVDFAYSSGTATLAPGETTKTIAVQIIGNAVYQHNRKFKMKMWLDAANRTNAAVFGGGGQAVIVDDDPKPTLTVGDVAVVEGHTGATLAVVTATLTGETALPASVNYTTVNQTAVVGGDYAADSGTLTFAPGETSKTIVLSVVGDTAAEDTESFGVSFTNAIDMQGKLRAAVTIIDDDSTSWVSTTVADFTAGTVDAGAYISRTNNGEVILAPTLGAEFQGSQLPADWTSTPLGTGGTSTVGNRWVSIDGAALVGGAAGYGAGRSLEFAAIFTGAAGQYGGFSSTGMVAPPFAMFGVRVANTLVARTVSGATVIETPIVGNFFNGSQTFRIEWNASTIVYFVNNKKVATHNVAVGTPMRPTFVDSTVGTGLLAVAYSRMTPYAAEGNYTSAVFDAGAVVTWLSTAWGATLPAGTSAAFQYRTGNTPTPDESWTSFTTVPASGAALTGSSRYLQFTVREATTDAGKTPVMKDITLAFKR